MEIYKKELTPVHYNKSAIKVLHFKNNPNHMCFPVHWHERVEMIYICEGELNIGYGKNIKKIKAGELIIIPPKTPHKGFTTNCGVDYHVLMYDIRSFYNDTEICKTYLPAFFDGRAKFKEIIRTPETISCFNKIINLSEDASLETTVEIYRLFSLMFKYDLDEITSEMSMDNTMSEIIQYIEDNYNQELSTASIASRFNYSSEHLCRKFKLAIGLTPMNYLKIFRLEKAQKILKNENINIKEVAESCGFDDANYFTRCFKSHFGVSPTKYRSTLVQMAKYFK